MAALPADVDVTAEQRQAIADLRGTMSVPEPRKSEIDDLTLLRFLRARQFNLEKARPFLEAAERWRVDFHVEELCKTFEYTEGKEVAKYYPQYYHKTDKEGRPLYIESLKNFDYKALYKATTPERQLQHLAVEYERFLRERLPACSAARGKTVCTSCTVMDLKNVGLTSFPKVKDYVQKAMAVGQNYYPETLGVMFIVNAPWIFSTIWSVVKLWLDAATVEKIHILGGNYEKTLLEHIPAESLPVEFGGTCACEGGCAFSDKGPWSK